ncbi:hypothetical protein MMC07_004352 [Pseudocyphellaria aurata]|nr:hypothetical protein [Pseudocyphellaria aurata]
MHPAILLSLALVPFSLAAKKSVKVGNTKGDLVFDPDTITAEKGDTIEFSFYPQNHSVAQSTFDKPCQALEDGIFSGFIPSESGAAKQIFTVTVNSTDPIWLYCSKEGHCQRGMAMVVNQPKDNTLKSYQSKALTAQSNSQPEVAGGVVSDSDQTLGSSSSSGSAASATGTASAASTNSANSATSATSAASPTSASAASTSPTSTPNAVGKLSAGAGMGALGLLGVMVGGMV